MSVQNRLAAAERKIRISPDALAKMIFECSAEELNFALPHGASIEGITAEKTPRSIFVARLIQSTPEADLRRALQIANEHQARASAEIDANHELELQRAEADRAWREKNPSFGKGGAIC